MKKNRLLIYFKQEPQKDWFFYGDRKIINWLKKVIFGRKIGGVEKVFINLCKSFDLLKIEYIVNLPFNKIIPQDKVIVLGLGRYSLKGYNKPNQIIAGIALMTHPQEWPTLIQDYPVVKYLQHSNWAKNVYIPYYGNNICSTWFAGIETEKWKPIKTDKEFDILIYNKIRWDHDFWDHELRTPILNILKKDNVTFREIVYGSYNEKSFQNLLNNCRAMIFLCEHESQGFACCEALSMNVPVLAWDQGYWLDPNRYKWGENNPVPATSVPFFDNKCGETFEDITAFEEKFPSFLIKVSENKFSPRSYVLENLSLEKSGIRMLEIINEVYNDN